MPPAGLALVAVSLGRIDLPASGGFVVGLCLHLLQAAVLFLMRVHQRATRDSRFRLTRGGGAGETEHTQF
jgi:hypothetical protein